MPAASQVGCTYVLLLSTYNAEAAIAVASQAGYTYMFLLFRF